MDLLSLSCYSMRRYITGRHTCEELAQATEQKENLGSALVSLCQAIRGSGTRVAEHCLHRVDRNGRAIFFAEIGTKQRGQTWFQPRSPMKCNVPSSCCSIRGRAG